MDNVRTVRKHVIKNSRIIVRCDFDVPLDEDGHIVDDTRITANIPTIKLLLENNNKLVLIAKLGRPKGYEKKLSLSIVIQELEKHFPNKRFKLVRDFRDEKQMFEHQSPSEIIVLENIRFYDDATRNDPAFAKSLASLCEVFVNDAFAMSHRDEPSVTGIPHYIPGYAGLLLENEVHTILSAIQRPRRPFVSVLGGAKIATKIDPIKKLMQISDNIVIGGGIANTFLKAHGYDIGDSLYEEEELEHARELIHESEHLTVQIHLPVDARVGSLRKDSHAHVVTLPTIAKNGHILDIGPVTADMYAGIISQAETIIWNGPMGVFEHEEFKHGTDEIYRAIIHNFDSLSIVGGGDTLAALSRKRQKNGIDHISTGGGAMLHLIQFEDLPGLKALRNSPER